MTNNTSPLVLFGAFIALIVAAASGYLRSDLPLIWQVSAGIGVVGVATFLYMEKALIKNSLSKKTTQYGLNAIVMSVIMLGIVVFVNLTANGYDVKKDLTKNKLHTLSEQSIKVLKGLQTDVHLRAFINPTQMQEFENIFEKYTYYTPKLIKEYIDVDKDPFAVQKFGIKQAGTIIVESDARTARVENIQGPEDPKLEEKLTNAIIQVAKGDRKKIYFVSGHGEHMLTDTSREGYSEIKETLENGRYKVEELMLLGKDAIPADADIIVIAGPKSDFMQPELTAIEKYLRGGGKALIMVEPTGTPTLQGLLAKFGAEWKPKKAILETNKLTQLAGGNPLTPIVATYDSSSEITRDAKQPSIFPISTPVEKAAAIPTGLTVTSLLKTSAQSLEVAVEGDKVRVDQKTDRKGPLSLALAISGKMEPEKKPEAKADQDKKDKPAAEIPKPAEMRLVVVGDSDFPSNSVRKFGINADLFQNMLSWLAHEEDLISIRPKPTDSSEFDITEFRQRVIFLASAVFFPAMMMLSALGVWIVRRRK